MGLAAAALAALLTVVSANAQPTCPDTPAYAICDLAFELTAADPDPYATARIHIEFRSPRHKTFLLPGFWDGGEKVIVRFAPTEAGPWDYRISSNIARFDGKEGHLNAPASDSPGYVHPANIHHWATENKQPHLWMGVADAAASPELIAQRARQKFNHMIVRVAAPATGSPDPARFRELDQRILAMNRGGITADLALDRLPATWQQRERFIRYLVGRFSPMNITWLGLEHFEEQPNGRELLKELGLELKKIDPYQHPRTTSAAVTSSPLLGDGWMNSITGQSNDEQIGAVEHQLYPTPFVNALSGKTADDFRHALWNNTMNGQYPVMLADPALDAANAKVMSAWFDFFADTRHWELEPFFEVDGGRGLALEEVEYIVYVEKPGPIEVTVIRHGYDVRWMNPANGEVVNMKEFKGEHFASEPPDRTHDWVLHLSRDGHKQSMLNSYKFESQPVPVQEIDQIPSKVPFEVVEPAAQELSVARPVPYSLKIRRETRATRSMTYLWTGEVAADGQSFRVLGTGSKGTFRIPPGLAKNFPAVFHVRVSALNANGKAYSVDRVFQLNP